MIQIFDRLRRQKSFRLKSQGSSMLPILRPNDVIYYRRTTFRRCQLNDLIMVKKNSNFFTHRVIYKSSKRSVLTKDGPYLITKGDNNLESDGKIFPRQVIAKVYEIKRSGQLLNPENIYLLQSTLYFQEIVKIKKLFEREKIDFVFLKGLPLHLYYEKSHPKRFYLDCDVLVERRHFLKAEKILFLCGYKKAKTELSSAHKKMPDQEIENAYYKIINGFSVVFDLHVEVVFMMTQLGKLEAFYPQSLINQLTEEFLKTKRIVKIQGETFSIPSSPNLILYLALHFFHHNFRGAFRLEFLAKAIKKEKLTPITVKYLTVIVKRYQLENFIYPILVLLKKYYQAPVPSNLLSSIKPLPFYTFKLLHLDGINVFDNEPRVAAGINRFKNLFILSPQPLWRKIFVIFNPQVLYSIFWVFQLKLSSFFSGRKSVLLDLFLLSLFLFYISSPFLQ